MKNITIQELLSTRGIDDSTPIKLIRHKTSSLDFLELYKTDKATFLKYQARQEKDVFGKFKFIVSFIGEEGTRARFIGVYKIISMRELPVKLKNIDNTYYKFEYEIFEVTGFENLIERIIIDWGKGAMSWHQHYSNMKEVVEIHPGLNYRHFNDYFDFILTFNELKEIVETPYLDWKKMLKATNGIYLIQDTSDGKQYVGSATREDDGIWGRWSDYVKTNGHGGNLLLKNLVLKDTSHAIKYFKFTILMLLPKTITREQAIEKEKLFKKKLGSRAFGLNLN
jgi:hypothetical protein